MVGPRKPCAGAVVARIVRSVAARESSRTKADWIAAAIDALDEGGIEAVRVEPLAVRLGVTKGSFYWHFADRDELLAAVLAAWERLGTLDVIDQVDRAGGDAKARVRHLWSIAHGSGRMAAEHAIRDWARRAPKVDEVVRRVDERRLDYLRALLRELGWRGDDLEARALLAYSLLIGDHFVKGRTTKAARKRALERALALLAGE
jgi:AcrR family transcriptional regulator